MKRYLLSIALALAFVGKGHAQSVTVDASIDSLQILIGEQAKVKLEVSLDANKRAIFPAFRDTLVTGVEIVDIAKPDTQLLNDGKRALITQEYTVTSFDSALYYLPPMEVMVDNQTYRSKALALKVYSVPVDTLHPDQFFGPKTIMKAPLHGKTGICSSPACCYWHRSCWQPFIWSSASVTTNRLSAK